MPLAAPGQVLCVSLWLLICYWKSIFSKAKFLKMCIVLLYALLIWTLNQNPVASLHNMNSFKFPRSVSHYIFLRVLLKGIYIWTLQSWEVSFILTITHTSIQHSSPIYLLLIIIIHSMSSFSFRFYMPRAATKTHCLLKCILHPWASFIRAQEHTCILRSFLSSFVRARHMTWMRIGPGRVNPRLPHTSTHVHTAWVLPTWMPGFMQCICVRSDSRSGNAHARSGGDT